MIERRKHKRYVMPRGTLAILRSSLGRLREHSKMQIGEIAMVLYKSETSAIGQVSEMSLSGLSFSADQGMVSENAEDELDLLMTEQGLYLHNVPYMKVPERRDAENATIALRFGKLNAEHRGQLQELLGYHVG